MAHPLLVGKWHVRETFLEKNLEVNRQNNY